MIQKRISSVEWKELADSEIADVGTEPELFEYLRKLVYNLWRRSLDSRLILQVAVDLTDPNRKVEHGLVQIELEFGSVIGKLTGSTATYGRFPEFAYATERNRLLRLWQTRGRWPTEYRECGHSHPPLLVGSSVSVWVPDCIGR